MFIQVCERRRGGVGSLPWRQRTRVMKRWGRRTSAGIAAACSRELPCTSKRLQNALQKAPRCSGAPHGMHRCQDAAVNVAATLMMQRVDGLSKG